MDIQLTSTAFEQGGVIPKEHTADGRNVSPPLRWSDPPAGSKSFALICEDPDAPQNAFTHWVIFNVPADSRALAEGVPHDARHVNGTTQGCNGFGKVAYSGPAPPP